MHIWINNSLLNRFLGIGILIHVIIINNFGVISIFIILTIVSLSVQLIVLHHSGSRVAPRPPAPDGGGQEEEDHTGDAAAHYLNCGGMGR